jgi:hypothetical protein
MIGVGQAARETAPNHNDSHASAPGLILGWFGKLQGQSAVPVI